MYHSPSPFLCGSFPVPASTNGTGIFCHKVRQFIFLSPRPTLPHAIQPSKQDWLGNLPPPMRKSTSSHCNLLVRTVFSMIPRPSAGECWRTTRSGGPALCTILRECKGADLEGVHIPQLYKRAWTTFTFTIHTIRSSKDAFGWTYCSHLYRLKRIHSAITRRSISAAGRFKISVTVPVEKQYNLAIFNPPRVQGNWCC